MVLNINNENVKWNCYKILPPSEIVHQYHYYEFFNQHVIIYDNDSNYLLRKCKLINDNTHGAVQQCFIYYSWEIGRQMGRFTRISDRYSMRNTRSCEQCIEYLLQTLYKNIGYKSFYSSVGCWDDIINISCFLSRFSVVFLGK